MVRLTLPASTLTRPSDGVQSWRLHRPRSPSVGRTPTMNFHGNGARHGESSGSSRVRLPRRPLRRGASRAGPSARVVEEGGTSHARSRPCRLSAGELDALARARRRRPRRRDAVRAMSSTVGGEPCRDRVADRAAESRLRPPQPWRVAAGDAALLLGGSAAPGRRMRAAADGSVPDDRPPARRIDVGLQRDAKLDALAVLGARDGGHAPRPPALAHRRRVDEGRGAHVGAERRAGRERHPSPRPAASATARHGRSRPRRRRRRSAPSAPSPTRRRSPSRGVDLPLGLMLARHRAWSAPARRPPARDRTTGSCVGARRCRGHRRRRAPARSASAGGSVAHPAGVAASSGPSTPGAHRRARARPGRRCTAPTAARATRDDRLARAGGPAATPVRARRRLDRPAREGTPAP